MHKTVQSFLVVLFSLFLLLVVVKNCYALTISISGLPASVDRDQETDVNMFFECSGCGDSYMRGVFYPGGTNYFGFTKNNLGSWVGTSADRSQYFKIAKSDLVEASWSGKIRIKPDSQDSAYSGPGEYFFKIGRYTSAGDSSADWSNELSIRLTGPTSTPTPTSGPTQTPTSTPTNTPTAASTKTPTPKPSPTKTPSPTPSSSPEVLGESATDAISSPKPLDEVESETLAKKKFPFLPVILIGSGLSMVGLAVLQLINAAKGNKTGTPLDPPNSLGGSNF